MTTDVEQFTFQAETRQLLDLMVHSLYTQRDIFLRELISNASDALDRLRFEAILEPNLLDADHRAEIRLEVDREARTLTVSDSGIGMRRDGVVANLGTIARSGTRELRERLRAGGTSEGMADLIGRFGVGFYSLFMVADRVRVVTRYAGDADATEWVSTGDGTFTVASASRPQHGTSVTLFLKAPDEEAGIEDYTDRWRLGAIVSRYSDFIAYPIVYAGENAVLNSMKPIWTRAAGEVTKAEHAEFYRHLSRDGDEPLRTIHFSTEGTFAYQALLYLPSHAPYDLYYVAPEIGLRLFANRVLITERCDALLPRYLRFVKGVVDAADLPLNISRQRLQQDAHLALICRRITRKVLDALEQMAEHDAAAYSAFWREFGRAIKEGLGSDFDNRDRLLGLLRFQSSHDAEALTSLPAYVARMKPDQTPIFYLTGESRKVVERSPHTERLLQQGYEILYLVDPVDELMLQYLKEYDGKPLKSVGKGVVTTGEETETDDVQARRAAQTDALKGLVDYLAATLAADIKQVRLTNRLTASPACLVVEEHEYSPVLERVLRTGAGPLPRRVLELNPTHPLIERLRARHEARPDDPALADAAELLYGFALLAEGTPVSDPVRFSQLSASVLERALS